MAAQHSAVVGKESSEYRIEPYTSAHRSVEAWSTSRLPFEPNKVPARPWLLEFRDRLREELRRLSASAEEMLLAEFATDEMHLFDVENVLLYNVGLDAFRGCGHDGVRFDRRDWGSIPRPLGGAHCYHRYATAPIAEAALPVRGSIAARWSDVPVDAFGHEPTASKAWFAMRTAETEVSPPAAGAPFQVRLTLDVPETTRASAVHLLKPLLDGTISAFHDYVGTDLDRMSLRLASVLREEQPRIRSLLAGSGLATLGPRRVIGAWGETTQWNPADDLCSAASLVLRHRPVPGWRLSGELITLRASSRSAPIA